MMLKLWISASGSRRNPLGGRLLFYALVLLVCALFNAQICAAQSASQDQNGDQSNSQSYSQQSGSTSYQQTCLNPDQNPDQNPDDQVCQNPDQQTGQYSDQQNGQYSNQQTGQYPSQETGQYPSQETGQYPNQETGQYPNQEYGQTPSSQQNGQNPNYPNSQQMGQNPSWQQYGNRQVQIPPLDEQPQNPQEAAQAPNEQEMSAEQIISILEQEPEIRQSIKIMMVRQSGDDSIQITDGVVYERIRQDARIRDIVTKELIRRGYSPDIQFLIEGSPKAEEMRPPKTNEMGNRRQTLEPVPPYESPDNPQVQHRYSPYQNMPSLWDLYSQFPNTPAKLRRFGSDAFLIGAENAYKLVNQLPLDIPAGPDYVLGPADSITVNLWGVQSGRLLRIIDRGGQVELPEVGTVMISGMTIAQAQNAIQKALNLQYQGEHVEISLGRLRTVRVYVVGDVQRPGAYDVSALSTPLSALYAAGGPTNRGSLRILRHYRGTQLVRQEDLYDFLLRGVRSDDERLQAGDTILVPPAGPQVSVEGMVHRPAIYELNGEQDLSQVLDLAGGLLVSASLKQINVQRIEAHEKRTMFNLQLPDIQTGIQQKLAEFKVKDGDDVVIRQIQPYNEQAVYLEGHVFHPGKYAYHDGMTINDLLRSYQDVLPEPADHAEIVRLQPPDYRPVTISINLPDVFIGNDTTPLEPFDLVRIYGRYEADAPSVTIQGEVLRPGRYPMSKGLTVTELIQMAGGFRRSAYRDQADLSSYVVQNGQTVLVKHTEIPIQKALAGDKSADVALKSGDAVSIRRLTGWLDIGASVLISGEVGHPGSYGIQEGERLSDVLRRAGGFLGDAYPYAAVLERTQVRQLEFKARDQMIRQIEETPAVVNPGTDTSSQTVQDLQKSLDQQRREILTNLRTAPVSGRLVINITSDISKWENTSADIELRAGDFLYIPKRPNFVAISGQVYNPVAISYVPGKNLDWYFRKAGGASSSGNKGHIYVIRADGSVVPMGNIFQKQSFMSLRMRPGDTIFVPQKIVGGSQLFQNIAGTAEIISALALPFALSGKL